MVECYWLVARPAVTAATRKRTSSTQVTTLIVFRTQPVLGPSPRSLTRATSTHLTTLNGFRTQPRLGPPRSLVRKSLTFPMSKEYAKAAMRSMGVDPYDC
jgi:hypothetical protein